MTRIDFHSNVPDKIAYACRLVRKARAHAGDCKIVLLCANRQQQDALDQALWTFSDVDFIPHVALDSPLAAQTPVILTDSDAVALPHYAMLINLTPATPAHFARFERVFEIIAKDETDAVAGRKRYAFYKQQGYALTHCVAA
jgi:DNA polymerase-3 subunit chi